jgi:putative redox protein
MSVPVDVLVEWQGEQVFAARAGSAALTLDGSGQAGVSPVQALALSLASCMAIDVVHILTKGRVPVKACTARLHGERAGEDPRRLVRAELRFFLVGDVPREKVERAISLSREKYCSVWHSLRTDIALETGFEIAP